MKFRGQGWRTLCLLPLCVLGSVAEAAPSEADWGAWNTAVIDQHVVPRYQTLASEAAEMGTAVSAYCTGPTAETLATAQVQYREAMAAWQGVQHVHFGPVLYLMRDSAMQFWPDRKNIGRKQLQAALTQPEGAYDRAFFRDASISIKGFPALERLLFDRQIDTQRGKYPRYCELMTAIAGNVAQMTGSIAEQWGEARSQYTEAGHNDFFEEAVDASTQLLKGLVEPLEVLRDTKILRAIGDAPGAARWKKSESWRSAHSIGNLAANVAALDALYQGTTPVSLKSLLQAESQAALADQISASFARLSETIAATPEPADDALSEAQWQTLQTLANDLRNLNAQLDEAMIALGINLGFNSRDGD